jgi:hypothetical protein
VQVFQDKVKSQLVLEMGHMMDTIGPIPIEDEGFLKVLELARKPVDEKRRHSKSGDKAPKKEDIYKNNKENKIKVKKEKKRTTIRIMRRVKSKKESRRKNASINFENMKDALKGMSKKMITKHKDTKANCSRCRHEGPYTLEYYAKTTENGEEIVKAMISTYKKRKHDDYDNASRTTGKKAKIAATWEHVAAQENRI